MLLSELIRAVSDVRTENFSECEVTSVTDNSKAVRVGSVFVAKRGANYNGADFIPDARERGAGVYVCESKVSVNIDETLIISKNPTKTMAEISNALFGYNLSKMKIIGITGTKGKTTTLKILAQCLTFAKVPLVSISTLGTEFYGTYNKFISTENTTPEAPFIYETLRNAYNAGIRHAIIEVSSQALANYRVFGIPFTVCIFTNISEDHIGIGEHKSYREYFEAKRSLFTTYRPAFCIVNADDPAAEKITSGAERVIKVGEYSTVFQYKPLFDGDRYVEFSLCGKKFRLSLGGRYNGKNASLALAAASLITGKDVKYFKECLGNVTVPGRYEVYSLNGIKIIIDFAHNKKSFEAICESVAGSCNGRLTVLFGSVGERCRARRPQLAAVAERYADFSVITSDNPGNEPAERIALEIYSHFNDKSKAKVITDRERAIYFAISESSKGDTVLLLGKGQESYQLIGNEKIPFSEKEILKKLGAEEVRY